MGDTIYVTVFLPDMGFTVPAQLGSCSIMRTPRRVGGPLTRETCIRRPHPVTQFSAGNTPSASGPSRGAHSPCPEASFPFHVSGNRGSEKQQEEAPGNTLRLGLSPGAGGALPALFLSGSQLAQEAGFAPQVTEKETEAQSRERTCLRSPAC